MDHPFFDCVQYLSEEDYANLIQYIDNLKNNIKNDKMLIFYGPRKTGKTSLKNAIRCYLGQNQCYDIIGRDCMNSPIRKVFFKTEIDEIQKAENDNVSRTFRKFGRRIVLPVLPRMP